MLSGLLRDLGKRRPPADVLVENVVAEKLVEHLERCGRKATLWDDGAIDVDTDGSPDGH